MAVSTNEDRNTSNDLLVTEHKHSTLKGFSSFFRWPGSVKDSVELIDVFLVDRTQQLSKIKQIVSDAEEERKICGKSESYQDLRHPNINNKERS